MKPILFNTEMVKAILDGRKTVTRRLMKIQPWGVCDSGNEHQLKDIFKETPREFCCRECGLGVGPTGHSLFKSPYRIGDIIYVRETWRIGAWNEDENYIYADYKADGYCNTSPIEITDSEQFDTYWWQSTCDAEKVGTETDEYGQFLWDKGKSPTRWRLSIHMPKEAARIFLKITDVRVERLQDITEEQNA